MPPSEIPLSRHSTAAVAPGGVYVLCELLRERIRSGHYGEEGRLPDDFVLIRELSVSRTLLRAALETLREEGTLTRRRGHGTFASRQRLAYRPQPFGGFVTTLAAQDVAASHEVLCASTWAMDPLTASDFGVHPGTPLHVIERLTLLAGEPLSFGAYVVRGDLAPTMLRPELRDRGLDLRDWLAESSIVPVTHVDVTVEAVAADARVAGHLDCPEGMPMLRMNRHFTTTDGDLLAFGSGTMRGDRFAFRADRQRLDSISERLNREVHTL